MKKNIEEKYPYFRELEYTLDYLSGKTDLRLPEEDKAVVNELQGYYVELESGRQATFLDDRLRCEYEESYHIRTYCPNSRLIAISSVAILWHKEFGYYTKGWGDLDENDAHYVRKTLREIACNLELLETILDY